MSICLTPNINATSSARALVEEFTKCAAAKSLLGSLASFDKSLEIRAEGSSPHLHYPYVPAGPIKAQILMPKNRPLSDLLDSLAFEIQNFIKAPKFNRVLSAAANGDVGMQSFVRKVEDHEYGNHYDANLLMKKCARIWKVPFKTFSGNSADSLIMQDFSCHSDIYRAQWIDNFKSAYCKKHPEDSRSCQTRRADLCDFKTLKTLDKTSKDLCYVFRVCERFPFMPKKTAMQKAMISVVRNFCPEIVDFNQKGSSARNPYYKELAARACPMLSDK